MTQVCSDETWPSPFDSNLTRPSKYLEDTVFQYLHYLYQWTRYSNTTFERILRDMFKLKLNTMSWGKEFVNNEGTWDILKYGL